MIKNKIQKILVPLDGSKNSFRALDAAISLARNSQAVIIGVYVMPMSIISSIQPAGFIPPVSNVKFIDISKHLSKEAEKFMSDAKIRSAKKGIIFKSKIMHGQPGPDIIRVAHNKKNKFDLIVIGTRGRSSAKELFFGSTSKYVVHKSKIPVLIIK